MNFNKTGMAVSLALALGFAHVQAQAATLNTGDQLTIDTGVTAVDASGNKLNVTVSWFGMDSSSDGSIQGYEKFALSQGSQGIIIGTAQAGSGSHGGVPDGSETSVIVIPWTFFGNTGLNYTSVGVTGSTTAGLDFSGWGVGWNGIPAIPMGTSAWGAGYSNGVANFVWDGVYGHSYTLNYHATVPAGDPSGFGNVKYALHLQGVVNEGAKVASASPDISATPPANVSNLAVTFNKAMTVSSGFLTISGGGASLGSCTGSGTTTYSCALSGIAASNTYTVTLDSTKAVDSLGVNPNLGSYASYSFTTVAAETTPPLLSSVSPANSATSVAASSSVVVTFNEAMGSTTTGAISVSAGGTPVSGTVTASSGNTVYTFTPTNALSNNTVYTVTVTGGSGSGAAADAVGNKLAATSTTTFTTASVASLTDSGSGVTVSTTSGSMTSLSVTSSGGGTPPSGVIFDNEFVNYSLNGVAGSATVTITFPASITGKTLYKVKTSGGVTTYTAISETTAGCVFSRVGDASITMTIVDGGACDADGAANGVITDPIVAGTVTATTTSTLSSAGSAGGGCAMNPAAKFDLGMILTLLGGLGYVGWRRMKE